MNWIFFSRNDRDKLKGWYWSGDVSRFYIATKPRKFCSDSSCVGFTMQKEKYKWNKDKKKKKDSFIKVWKYTPKSEPIINWMYSISFRPCNRPFRWLTMWKIWVDYLVNLFKLSIFFIRYYSNKDASIFPTTPLSWIFIYIRMWSKVKYCPVF